MLLVCLWTVGRGTVVKAVKAQMRANIFDVSSTTVYKHTQTHLVPHLQVVKYYSRPVYEDPPYLLKQCTETYLGKSTLGSVCLRSL